MWIVPQEHRLCNICFLLFELSIKYFKIQTLIEANLLLKQTVTFNCQRYSGSSKIIISY
jgi:hypothetical protein